MKSILEFVFAIVIVVNVRAQDFAHVDFTAADSVADQYAGYPLNDIHKLATELTQSLRTEEEKFRALYKWVCDNVQYDYDLQMRDKQAKRKMKSADERNAWSKSFSIYVLKELRERRKTVCTGYAYLLRVLAAEVGIECKIIDGYCRNASANFGGSGSPNHSWNAVRLYQKWYLCDATWSSGHVDDKFNFVQHFDGTYFLPDPGIFVRNHYPLDTAWTLLSHNQSLKEFLNGPLIYKSAFQFNVQPVLPATFDVRIKEGETVTFQFRKDDRVIIDKASFFIKTFATTENIPSRVDQRNDGMCVMKYTFLKKGKFTLHILINEGYAFTYSVKVS